MTGSARRSDARHTPPGARTPRPVAPAAHRHPAEPDRFLARPADRSAQGPARARTRGCGPGRCGCACSSTTRRRCTSPSPPRSGSTSAAGCAGRSATWRRSAPTSCGCSPRTRSPPRSAPGSTRSYGGSGPACGCSTRPRCTTPTTSPTAFRGSRAAGVRVPRTEFGPADVGVTPVVYKAVGEQAARKELCVYDGPRPGFRAAVAHDSRGADGRYRRYRAFVLGDLVLPEDVIVADHWNASLRHLVTVERNYALTDAERQQLLLINSTLGLDFSCVDYLRERDTGAPVFHDVNVYPTVVGAWQGDMPAGDHGRWHVFDNCDRLGLAAAGPPAGVAAGRRGAAAARRGPRLCAAPPRGAAGAPRGGRCGYELRNGRAPVPADRREVRRTVAAARRTVAAARRTGAARSSGRHATGGATPSAASGGSTRGGPSDRRAGPRPSASSAPVWAGLHHRGDHATATASPTPVPSPPKQPVPPTPPVRRPRPGRRPQPQPRPPNRFFATGHSPEPLLECERRTMTICPSTATVTRHYRASPDGVSNVSSR